MRRNIESLVQLNLDFDSLSLPDKEDLLFLDIETTGLSPRNSFIYMIGLSYYNGDGFVFEGLMADNAREEEALLREFAEKIKNFKALAHFNGNRFDIPFIKDRCEANGVKIDLTNFENIDIYKRINPYKHLFRLPNCKQKTIEEFMGICREDKYSGGELISVYKEYSETHSEELYSLLYQHNRDDVAGMLEILPMLNYHKIFDQEVSVDKVSSNCYKDYYGDSKCELLIEFTLNSPARSQISFDANGIYGSFKCDRGVLKVPVFHEELKLFFDNYKDYFYLPEEDMAVHKAVSVYVDKDYRKPATAATCYTRHAGDFLPQWDNISSPAFRRNYKDRDLFFQLTEDILTDYDFFGRYVSHLLKMISENAK